MVSGQAHKSIHTRRGPAGVPPTVIVGLGNDIAGDDGVGVRVAERLTGVLCRRADVEVLPLPWAGFNLLDVLAFRNCAAIIDCVRTGRYRPGTILRLSEADFRGSVRLNSFHDINYSTVLALGRHLGWRMPSTIAIWGIEGAVLDRFAERLSPAVAAAADVVYEEVLQFLEAGPRHPGRLARASGTCHNRTPEFGEK